MDRSGDAQHLESGREASSAATTAFVPPDGCGCPSPTYDCPSEPCCTDSSCCCHISSQNRGHGASTPDGVERGLERSSAHAPDASVATKKQMFDARYQEILEAFGVTEEERPAAQDRDWHEYECAHEHRWWSAPTSACCPVCAATTYTPIKVLHGQIGVMTAVKFDA